MYLAQVTEKFQFDDKVKPVKLPEKHGEETFSAVNISGYRLEYIDDDDGHFSFLKVATVYILPHTYCLQKNIQIRRVKHYYVM